MVKPISDEEVEYLAGPADHAGINFFNNVFFYFKSDVSTDTSVISGPPSMRYDEFCAMAIGRLVNMNIAANGVQLVEIDNLPEDTLLSYIRETISQTRRRLWST